MDRIGGSLKVSRYESIGVDVHFFRCVALCVFGQVPSRGFTGWRGYICGRKERLDRDRSLRMFCCSGLQGCIVHAKMRDPIFAPFPLEVVHSFNFTPVQYNSSASRQLSCVCC